MKYFFFLDETGDHGLSFIDKNFPLFLLCGCLIREDRMALMEQRINDFKVKFFNSREVILHSREIRKCEGPFQVLFDLSVKAQFYEQLNDIIKTTDYIIIGGAVNKEEHIKKYGKGAQDPYALSFSFIIERLIFCLDTLDGDSTVFIEAEERGKKEDALLIAHYNRIMDRGTFYLKPERLSRRIKSFQFFSKRQNRIGLQLSDLNAYPLARYILDPEVPYVPFDIIQRKIYCDKDGSFDGWGLKQFP